MVDSGGLRGGELCPFLERDWGKVLQEKKKKDDDGFAFCGPEKCEKKNSGSGRRLGVWVQVRWPGVPICGVLIGKKGRCEISGAVSGHNVD